MQVAGSYAALSALLRASGRRAEALTYAQVALEAKQRAFGPQHAEVAGSMLHLADLLRDLGRWPFVPALTSEPVSFGVDCSHQDRHARVVDACRRLHAPWLICSKSTFHLEL